MAPMTLLGVLQLALGARPHSRSADGVLLFVANPRSPLCWYMKRLRINAWTLGAVVLYREASSIADERLYRHELEHVFQTMVMGPLMPFAYVGSSLWEWARGRHLYFDNAFERRARAAEPRDSP
jgi:hypothetical protein